MDQFGGSQKEYILAVTGGVILCIATSLHLLLKGRVTGLAGFFFSVIKPDRESIFWRLAFFSGIILATSLMVEVFENRKNQLPKEFQFSLFDPPFKKLSDSHFYWCTSGHGICGLPRLSIRSIVAVLAFMFTGVATATIKYQLGYTPIIEDLETSMPQNYFILKSGLSLPLVTGGFAISLTIFLILINLKTPSKVLDMVITFIVGLLMCFGINLAGMGKSSKVINFLTLRPQWDPSLMFIMGGAVLGNFITFYIIINVIKKPLFSQFFGIPTNKLIDWKLVCGALIFGVGWGICGICPGSAMTILSLFYKEHILFYVLPMAIGQYSAFYVAKIEEDIKKAKDKKAS